MDISWPEPPTRVGEDKKYYDQLTVKDIYDVTISPGSVVLLEKKNPGNSSESPTVKVSDLSEDVSTGEMFLRGHCLYRPEALKSGRKPFHGVAELIPSAKRRAFSLSGKDGYKIISVCIVDTAEAFRRRSEFPPAVNYVSEFEVVNEDTKEAILVSNTDKKSPKPSRSSTSRMSTPIKRQTGISFGDEVKKEKENQREKEALREKQRHREEREKEKQRQERERRNREEREERGERDKQREEREKQREEREKQRERNREEREERERQREKKREERERRERERGRREKKWSDRDEDVKKEKILSSDEEWEREQKRRKEKKQREEREREREEEKHEEMEIEWEEKKKRREGEKGKEKEEKRKLPQKMKRELSDTNPIFPDATTVDSKPIASSPSSRFIIKGNTPKKNRLTQSPITQKFQFSSNLARPPGLSHKKQVDSINSPPRQRQSSISFSPFSASRKRPSQSTMDGFMRKKPKLSTLDDDSSQSGLSSFEAQSQEGERKKKPSINDVLGRRPRRTIKDEDDENRSFTDEEEDTNTVGDSLDGFVVSDDEDSFEDDDDSQSAALPSRLAFSDEGLPMRHMSAKMDFSEAYPIFLQYCVSSLLADDFEQLILETPDEGYFLPAKKKIEDFFVTRRKEVCSSVWDQAFLIKLHTYPRFRSWADKQTAHKCVACRRGKDTASWKAMLEGPECDANTFWGEPYRLPDGTNDYSVLRQTELTLGSHCHKITKLYHDLSHFKFRTLEMVEKRKNAILEKNGDMETQELLWEICSEGWVKTQTGLFLELVDKITRFLTQDRGRGGD